MSKTLGVLGGMGPAATADFFKKLVSTTESPCDQQHLHVIIDNNSQIPDRIHAFNNNGPSPVPAMLQSLHMLERAGTDFIVMPCNTAHVFLDELKKHTSLPFLSIIDCAVEFVGHQYPQAKKIGLLATGVTLDSGLYDQSLRRHGHNAELIKPSAFSVEHHIMKAVYEIKANNLKQCLRHFRKAAAELVENGAELILMACTEIPLSMTQRAVRVPLLDTTGILAAAAIKFAQKD